MTERAIILALSIQRSTFLRSTRRAIVAFQRESSRLKLFRGLRRDRDFNCDVECEVQETLMMMYGDHPCE